MKFKPNKFKKINLMKGGVLQVIMGNEDNNAWGAKHEIEPLHLNKPKNKIII